MTPIVTTIASSASRPKTRISSIGGNLSWMLATCNLPSGITADPITGHHIGKTVSIAAPTWARTVDLTDSGNAATNGATLANTIASELASITGNTRIRLPSGWVGTHESPTFTNNSPYVLGIEWNDGGALPAGMADTFDGVTMPSASSRFSISTHTTAPQWQPAAGARSITWKNGKWWLRGIHFANPSAVLIYFWNTIDNVSGFVARQCGVSTGFTTASEIRLQCAFRVLVGSQQVAIVECDTRKLGYAGADNQFVGIRGGGSGFRIENNYMEGAGTFYGVLLGGSPLENNDPNNIPRDGTYRWNTVTQPAEFDALTAPMGKSIFESKFGKRWLLEFNFVPRWPSTSSVPQVFAIKCSNQGTAGGTNVVSEDIWIRGNWMEYYSVPFAIVSNSGDGGPDTTLLSNRCGFCHNVGRNRNAAGYHAGTWASDNVTISNNTLITGGRAFSGWYGASPTVQNNIVAWVAGESNGEAFQNDAAVSGINMANFLALFTGTPVITNNLFTRAPGGFAGQILVGDNPSSVGFVNYPSDLALSPSSQGYQRVDGRDVGANMPWVLTALGGIR